MIVGQPASSEPDEVETHPNYLEPIHLIVSCVKCPHAPPFDQTVEAFLVSGLIIAYHSGHEGHQLSITANGKTYVPG